MFSRLFGLSAGPSVPDGPASIVKRRIHVLVTSLVSGGSSARVAPAVSALLKLVDKEKFIVGSLDAARVTTDPWVAQTSLVVLAPVCAELPRLQESVPECLRNYLMTGGQVLFLSDGTTPVTKEQLSETPLADLRTHESVTVLAVEDVESAASLAALKDALRTAGIDVAESAGEPVGESARDVATLACDDPTVIDELWSHWAMSSDSQLVMLPSNMSMSKAGATVADAALSESVLHLNVAPSASLSGSADFRWDTYFTQLKTSTIGRTVMHFNVVGSTQTVLDKHVLFLKSLPATAGLAIVANQQRSGRGRGGNGWISPRGSIAVTTVLKFDPIPPFLVFVQYVAGLAVVEAVRSVPGFEDLPLHVKWPNDIYFVDPGAERQGKLTPEQAIKLGGVLVTCQSMGSAVDVMVGVGVNVANPHPTVSLAQVTERWAALHGKRLEPLSVEYVLARFLTKFEELVAALSTGGFPAVSKVYYSRWLHTGREIRVADSGKAAIVQGIHEETGELLAEDPETREVIALSPGDNSFDILTGMVSRKLK